jgi:molybdenum cofactor guanylyltransferase
LTNDPAAVTGIVLAGGRSSRFGGDKLAAELDGETILYRAARAVSSVSRVVLIAGDSSTQLPSIPSRAVHLVADATAHAGPLAALADALHAVTTPLAIVVGGDMPAIVPAVLRAMLERLDANPSLAAVLLGTSSKDPSTHVDAGSDSRISHRQTLPCALRVATAAPAAEVAVREGDRSLTRLLSRLAAEELASPVWRALDPTGGTLFDVDEPRDLERLRSGEFP